MNATRLFALLLLTSLALRLPAQAPAVPAAHAAAALPYTRTTDVVYEHKDGVALTLDVFQPVVPANGCAVVAIVSGGWKSSHGAIAPGTYTPFLARGYTVFAVVHGSQPRYLVPEIIGDVHRAVRYIRHHAARWGIDPQKIGVTGGSAGGHLSLMLATQGGPGPATAKDPVDRESSAVQATACFYPPTDLLNYGSEGQSAMTAASVQQYLPAFGPDATTPEGRQRIGEQCSPARFVTAALPPVLLLHGDADTTVPLQQSELFIQRAHAIGANAVLIVRPGAGHGSKTWPDMQADRERMADWFDRYLRQREPTAR